MDTRGDCAALACYGSHPRRGEARGTVALRGLGRLMTASLWHYITMINVGEGRQKRGEGERGKRGKGRRDMGEGKMREGSGEKGGKEEKYG